MPYRALHTLKLRNPDPDLWVETRRNDRIVQVEQRGLIVPRGDSKTRCATPRTSSKLSTPFSRTAESLPIRQGLALLLGGRSTRGDGRSVWCFCHFTICYSRIWHHQFWLASNQNECFFQKEIRTSHNGQLRKHKLTHSYGQERISPGVGLIGSFSQAALNEARKCDARACGMVTYTIEKVG